MKVISSVKSPLALATDRVSITEFLPKVVREPLIIPRAGVGTEPTTFDGYETKSVVGFFDYNFTNFASDVDTNGIRFAADSSQIAFIPRGASFVGVELNKTLDDYNITIPASESGDPPGTFDIRLLGMILDTDGYYKAITMLSASEDMVSRAMVRINTYDDQTRYKIVSEGGGYRLCHFHRSVRLPPGITHIGFLISRSVANYTDQGGLQTILHFW